MSNESISDDSTCPFCGMKNQLISSKSWDQIGYAPVMCVQCAQLFWVKLPSNSSHEIVIVNRVPVFKTEIPELLEDTWIFIINKDHEKYLEPAKIVERSHKHYRVEFLDKMLLWVPSHWVERIPF